MQSQFRHYSSSEKHHLQDIGTCRPCAACRRSPELGSQVYFRLRECKKVAWPELAQRGPAGRQCHKRSNTLVGRLGGDDDRQPAASRQKVEDSRRSKKRSESMDRCVFRPGLVLERTCEDVTSSRPLCGLVARAALGSRLAHHDHVVCGVCHGNDGRRRRDAPPRQRQRRRRGVQHHQLGAVRELAAVEDERASHRQPVPLEHR
jgi:hypothetical protein